MTVSATKQSENRFAFAYYPKEFQNRKNSSLENKGVAWPLVKKLKLTTTKGLVISLSIPRWVFKS